MSSELTHFTQYMTSSSLKPDAQMEKCYAQACARGFQGVNSAPFSKALAAFALKYHWALNLIDVWTRVFDRHNEIRYKLNITTALLECHPEASRQFFVKSKEGLKAWCELTGLLVHFVLTFLLAMVFICGFYLVQRMAR